MQERQSVTQAHEDRARELLQKKAPRRKTTRMHWYLKNDDDKKSAKELWNSVQQKFKAARLKNSTLEGMAE